MRGWARGVAVVALLPVATAGAGGSRSASADGYLEWRQADVLVVDGQNVRTDRATRFQGQGAARDVASIPLGYEVKVSGVRGGDGSILARTLEAKPNGEGLVEVEVTGHAIAAESAYQNLAQASVSQPRFTEDQDQGLQRARVITASLIPPYVSPSSVRVYVVEDSDWNAFALSNFAIFVYRGLLDELDDDELAIVLGHELAHATHEHARRQYARKFWLQLGLQTVAAAAQESGDFKVRALAPLAAVLGTTVWKNGYNRRLEDQADRVGLRYAFEAGYDIGKGSRLWNRFAQKYGQPGTAANFFFGDHSRSSARALNVEREIALNYPDGPKAGGPRLARGTAVQPAPAKTGPGPHNPVGPGMTKDQVLSAWGRPRQESAVGSRTEWAYPPLMVVFEQGKVVWIEVRSTP